MMKFLAYLICYLIYPFSFLFPRSRRKWAFGSFRGAFNDNSKYMFIHASESLPEVDCVWLSISKSTVSEIRSKGLKAFHVISPKGIWFALTSKYWFFNAYSSDIMFCLSGNAVLVNLWHGLPMKRIEFEIKSGPLVDRFVRKTLKERFFHPETFRRPDYMLSSTSVFSDHFARSFRISKEQCLELGYPRNEILTAPESRRLRFIDRFEPESTRQLVTDIMRNSYHKVFVYMPTWRDSQRELFVQTFDMDRMNDILLSQNALLLLKPHANTIIDQTAFKQLSNVVLIDPKTDIYPILPFTDVLITDYSSVLYDYILMKDKDVILYLYDYEEYIKDRDFFYPYDENVVGKRVNDFKSLCDCIAEGDYRMDSAMRDVIVRKFWGATAEASACQSLVSRFAPKS